MHVHWRIIRRELLQYLREPKARAQFAALRDSHPLLHSWPQARLVASFLARRTPPLELRRNVAGLLLATMGGRGAEAQVAGAILLLAGVAILARMDRPGGPPPTVALLLFLGEPAKPPRREPALAFALPSLFQLDDQAFNRAEVRA